MIHSGCLDLRLRGVGAGLLLACLAAPALAQENGSVTDGQVAYGIRRDNGQLVRYDFDAHTLTNVGVIHSDTTPQMLGIEASAHIPSHQNIYAFWTDPSDGQVRLVYVDCESALAKVIGNPLGAGVMTGGTSVKTPDSGWLFPNPDNSQPVLDQYDYTIFGVHEVKAELGSGNPVVTGDININPNNCADNEFTVALPSGASFNRDDLNDAALVLPGNGEFYNGPASSVWVKPKGNGNQNGLTCNGTTYALDNAKTYEITSDNMVIRVYNDHVNGNGKAMGHWWVHIDASDVTIKAENEAVPVYLQSLLVGLYQIDHKTGQTRHLMALGRHYDSLATTNGATFYATSGHNLYRINPNNQTETLVGTTGLSHADAMEFLDTTLLNFENENHQLNQLSTSTAATVGFSQSIGTSDLGTLIFTTSPADPVNVPDSFD